MTRWRVEPAGPGGVHAWGLAIPPGGIECELDDATVALLEGDSRVTVERVPDPAPEPAPAARKPTRKRR